MKESASEWAVWRLFLQTQLQKLCKEDRHWRAKDFTLPEQWKGYSLKEKNMLTSSFALRAYQDSLKAAVVAQGAEEKNKAKKD